MNLLCKDALARQFIVYVCVGVLTALTDVGIMIYLTHQGLNPLLSASVAFFFAVSVNYTCHTYVTFKSKFALRNLGKYLVVLMICYLLTLAAVWVATILLVSPTLGKIVSLPFVAVSGYLLSKHWIYM